MNNDILALIESRINQDQRAGDSDNTPRRYLGASSLGVACDRARWYTFRWASPVTFAARMLRLFDRGHREEYRFAEWLRLIGCEVNMFSDALFYYPQRNIDNYRAIHWDNVLPADYENGMEVSEIKFHRERAKAEQGIELKQFGFKAERMWKHFAGNCDGRLRWVPGVEAFGVERHTWIMAEYKTHNAKSFAKLKEAKSVKVAKPQHYVQMQTYMTEIGFPLALYCAVGKDDDDMYFELVPPDKPTVAAFEPKIITAITAKQHPLRISKSPSWYDCKYCDHRPTCHFGVPMQKNCRTCIFSAPIENARWKCNKWGATIPTDVEPAGCDAWQEIKD